MYRGGLSSLLSSALFLTLSRYTGFPVGVAYFGFLEKKSEKIKNFSSFCNFLERLLENYKLYSQSERCFEITLKGASIWCQFWREIQSFDLTPSDWLNVFFLFFCKNFLFKHSKNIGYLKIVALLLPYIVTLC